MRSLPPTLAFLTLTLLAQPASAESPTPDQVRKALGQVYREIFGAHYPAMALVQVVRLVEKAARVEIEATAVVPR